MSNCHSSACRSSQSHLLWARGNHVIELGKTGLISLLGHAGPSLRDVVYGRIAQSDGCYVLVYSGLGEKLSLLGSLLGNTINNAARGLLADSKLNQYAERIDSHGWAIIEDGPEIHQSQSSASNCLKAIVERVKSQTSQGQTRHTVIVVDPTSLLESDREFTESSFISFQKSLQELVSSDQGITVIALYDAGRLDEGLFSRLIEFSGSSTSSQMKITPNFLVNEPKRMIGEGRCCPEIVALGNRVLFLDPLSDSSALLAASPEVLKETLPSDPLDVAQRDIAFLNNYTACQGACPYLSQEVQSGCTLDPETISTVKTRGQPFVRGRPCITAVDHVICRERPDENKNMKDDSCLGESSCNGECEHRS